MSFQLIGVKWLNSQHTSQDHKLIPLKNPLLLWPTIRQCWSHVYIITPNWLILWANYSWREVFAVDVSTKQNKSLIQLNWSWVQKPPSFFHILPIRQSWLESSFVWLEQGGDYQWHLSSATYHRSGAVLAHIGPAEHYGDSWDLSHTILEKMAPGLGQQFQR